LGTPRTQGWCKTINIPKERERKGKEDKWVSDLNLETPSLPEIGARPFITELLRGEFGTWGLMT
jgi:hypothetical protein